MASLKKTILKALERNFSSRGASCHQNFLGNNPEVAESVVVVEGKGVLVDWINREIGKILKSKDHHRLA